MKHFKLIKTFYNYPVIAATLTTRVDKSTISCKKTSKPKEKTNSKTLGLNLLRNRKVLKCNKKLITKGE